MPPVPTKHQPQGLLAGAAGWCRGLMHMMKQIGERRLVNKN